MVGDSGIGIFEEDSVTVETGSGLIHGNLRHKSNLTKFLVVLAVCDEAYMPEMTSETLTLGGDDISAELKDFYESEASGSFGCKIRFALFTGSAGQRLVADAAIGTTHGYYGHAVADFFRTNISFDTLTPVDVKDFKGSDTMVTATHTVVNDGFFLLFAFDYYMGQNFAVCTVNGIAVPFTTSNGLFRMVVVPAYTGDVINVKARTPLHGCSYGILKIE